MLLCTTVQTAATHHWALLFLVMFSLREKTLSPGRPNLLPACMQVRQRETGPMLGSRRGERREKEEECVLFIYFLFRTRVAALTVNIILCCAGLCSAAPSHVVIISDWAGGEIGERWKSRKSGARTLMANCHEFSPGQTASHHTS